MSAFYDLASLVLVPSGYKASKVYAQKPLTTDGQLTFSRASTATRVNSAGLIEAVSSNVPRLDYLGSSCPRLLLEPQRTNLATYSEQFDNAAWTKVDSTITANNAVSPDGSQNADLLAEATFTFSAATLATQTPIIVVTNTAYSSTIYAKAGTGRYLYFSCYYNAANEYNAVIVDLLNGTITKSQAGSAVSNVSNNVTSAGNGWYRISLTQTSSQVVVYQQVRISDVATPTIDATFGFIVVPSSNNRNVYLYGAQLEQGSYSSSYIPTTSAAVTRLVDSMSKSSYACGITTEATLFADFEYQNTGSGYSTQFLIYNVSAGHYIYLTVVSNSIRALCVSGGVLQSNIVLSGTTAGTRYKVAAKFKQNDFSLYVNGTLVGTDTSGTMPTFSTSGVTSYIGNDASLTEPAGYVRQYIAFPTALTNAQLAELTAL